MTTSKKSKSVERRKVAQRGLPAPTYVGLQGDDDREMWQLVSKIHFWLGSMLEIDGLRLRLERRRKVAGGAKRRARRRGTNARP